MCKARFCGSRAGSDHWGRRGWMVFGGVNGDGGRGWLSSIRVFFLCVRVFFVLLFYHLCVFVCLFLFVAISMRQLVLVVLVCRSPCSVVKPCEG